MAEPSKEKTDVSFEHYKIYKIGHLKTIYQISETVLHCTFRKKINEYLESLKMNIFRRLRLFVLLLHRLCNL